MVANFLFFCIFIVPNNNDLKSLHRLMKWKISYLSFLLFNSFMLLTITESHSQIQLSVSPSINSTKIIEWGVSGSYSLSSSIGIGYGGTLSLNSKIENKTYDFNLGFETRGYNLTLGGRSSTSIPLKNLKIQTQNIVVSVLLNESLLKNEIIKLKLKLGPSLDYSVDQKITGRGTYFTNGISYDSLGSPHIILVEREFLALNEDYKHLSKFSLSLHSAFELNYKLSKNLYIGSRLGGVIGLTKAYSYPSTKHNTFVQIYLGFGATLLL